MPGLTREVFGRRRVPEGERGVGKRWGWTGGREKGRREATHLNLEFLLGVKGRGISETLVPDLIESVRRVRDELPQEHFLVPAATNPHKIISVSVGVHKNQRRCVKAKGERETALTRGRSEKVERRCGETAVPARLCRRPSQDGAEGLGGIVNSRVEGVDDERHQLSNLGLEGKGFDLSIVCHCA